MATPNQIAFTASKTNDWPIEIWQITPNPNYIPTELGSVPAEMYFRFPRNPLVSINYARYTFTNTNTSIDALGLYKIDVNQGATFKWSLREDRSYFEGRVPPRFNALSIKNPYSPENPDDPYVYSSYVIFPQKLFLLPTSLSKVGGRYQLITKTCILDSKTYFDYGSSLEVTGALANINYNESGQQTVSFLPDSTTFTGTYNAPFLWYSLSSVRTRVDVPVITFTDGYNPNSFTIFLESPVNRNEQASCTIRPDSTFVTYNVDFYAKDELGEISLGNIGQDRFDIGQNIYAPRLKSGYIMDWYYFKPYTGIARPIATSNLQKFQLLQIKTDGNPTIDLSDSMYCVLTATFDLNNSKFTYGSDSYIFSRTNTIVNSVTGYPNSYIGVSYIADAVTFAAKLETVQSADYSYNSSFLNLPLNYPTGSGNQPQNTWNTKYPPHYYSNTVHFCNSPISPNVPKTIEKFTLTWYISAFPVSGTNVLIENQGYKTDSVTLKTTIVSDFGLFSYDLDSNYCPSDDLIKYTAQVDLSEPFLSSLKCYYGSSFNNTYSLTDSPWINAREGRFLKIEYPSDFTFGEIAFNLRPSLSTGAGISDGWKATSIRLGEDLGLSNAGQGIFLSKISEVADRMEVDASFLTVASAWPTRDLSGSNISWVIQANLPENSSLANDISLNAVDANGNYIKPLPFNIINYENGNVVYVKPKINDKLWFGNDTQSIVLSGYGPTQISISLSSLKYSELSPPLSSNPSLFDYFEEGKLLVRSVDGLDNQFKVRKIKLDALVPYKGRTYNIPDGSNINWVWSYNDNPDYNIAPITSVYVSYEGELLKYQYGTSSFAEELSSIYLEIEPKTYKIPNGSVVDVVASVDTRDGVIEGGKRFVVDNFPPQDIFDIYIRGYYYDEFLVLNKESDMILNTQNKKYVITRPLDGTTNYQLSAVTNNTANGTILWSVSSDTGFISDYINSDENLRSIIYSTTSVGTTLISVCAINALAPGWVSGHTVKTDITIYTLDYDEFYKPLNFLTIPQFFWVGNDKKLTITDQTNYTSFLANTAYAEKKSNSQGYFLSASKSYFDYYNYTTPATSFKTNSNYEFIDIPYEDSLFDTNGMRITLTAYNNTTYPEYNGIFYKMLVGNKLKTFAFNITANTVSNDPQPLKNPPRLLNYPTITAWFVPNLTAFDVDVDNEITVQQSVFPLSATSPLEVVNGAITYTLSSAYWSVDKIVDFKTGKFSLFQLQIGDPALPLTVSATKKTKMLLKASSNIETRIPPDTFPNYELIRFIARPSGDTLIFNPFELWNTVTQDISSIREYIRIDATSNSAEPQIYVSTAYTLTGKDIYVQYDTTETTDGRSIVAYATNFGEENSTRICAFDDTLFYQYKNIGTFFISFSALYNDGEIVAYQNPNPIFVLQDWEQYDPNKLRFVEEAILTLPYNELQISVQPNEWGDEDIFNTAIARLQDDLDYLISNTQTLNTTSPTVIFGWLGSNDNNLADGIRWYTRDYGSEYHLDPYLGISNGKNYFNRIVDAIETDNYTFVIDNTRVRILSAGAFAPEISFEGITDINNSIISPASIVANKEGSVVYLSDTVKQKVYKLELESVDGKNVFNYTIDVGGLGGVDDVTKFDAPIELTIAQDFLYVLDYNNHCVKQYNSDLSWIYTYKSDILSNEIAVNIDIHPRFGLLYVLTKTGNVHIFNQQTSEPFTSFPLIQIADIEDIIKIIFDEVGDFLYFVTSTTAYKYTPSGYYIGEVGLPSDVAYIGAKRSSNRSLLFITEKCIVKIQDILDTYKIGEGLPSKYWSLDQLKVNREEFSSDTNYNRSLIRMAQNIKTFRDSLNYKLVLATEQTETNVITYFASVPVSIGERPVFEISVEDETLGVGVNELHVPQSINKELKKLYDALLELNKFMNISVVNVNSTNCQNSFCWSWKGMSSYKLTFPSLRICNVNPITYSELELGRPVTYAPTKTWEKAISNCCDNVVPPV